MSKEIWGYARVSTKEQNLERQLVELRQYVPKEENIISDKQSGKDFDRTGYQSLRERVREGDELYIKSIYRLGRDKDAIKDELRFFKKKGVIVHILTFPQTMIEVTDEHQKSVMELVNNLLIEVFSFVAQEERENIRRRQAEGIALWRKTGKTKTGRPYGRPKIPFPSNWKKIYALVSCSCKATIRAMAWSMLSLPPARLLSPTRERLIWNALAAKFFPCPCRIIFFRRLLSRPTKPCPNINQ